MTAEIKGLGGLEGSNECFTARIGERMRVRESRSAVHGLQKTEDIGTEKTEWCGKIHISDKSLYTENSVSIWISAYVTHL